MKKRVMILYATYGNGHKAVAEYIKKYLESTGKYECKTFDLIEYSFPLFSIFSKNVSNFIMDKLPFLWSLVFKLFDNKVSSYISGNITLKMNDNKRLRKEIEEFNPEITISTHFFGNDIVKSYNKKNLINSKLVVVVTDYVAHECWLHPLEYIDAIIVGSVEEKIHLLKKGFKNRQIYTTGIPILPDTGNLNKTKLLKKFKINNTKKNILFFAGGGNGSLFNLIYFKEILKNDYDCNVLFIAGKNKLAVKKAHEYVKRFNKNNVKIYGYVNNINEFYHVSDIVITKPGGAQVTECLFFEKPMILIKSNGGQEVGNRRYLCRKGYAKWAKNKITFNNNLEELLYNEHIYKKMQTQIKKKSQNKSMEKLFKIVEKL